MEGASGKSSKKSPNKSKIATLSSLNQPQESSSAEEGQRFYVGGSDRSGQQVLGPSRDKKEAGEVIDNVFKAAKEQGATVVEQSPPTSRKATDPFKGKGKKLIPDGEEKSSGSQSPDLEPGEPVAIHLKMWQNGFSIDDGPLRSFDDQANREFLASISRGEVPRELIRQARGVEVSLNIEDHRTEEYTPSKTQVKAFAGEGHRLGAVTPETISSSVGLHESGDPKKDEETARQKLATDESKPVTNIQVRLADGSRMIVKVNLTHTVQDIRSYICEARPGYGPCPFILMTNFPAKTLSDESLTIEQANLQNATLTQKLV